MKKLDFTQFGDKQDRMFSILWLAYRATYPKQAVGYEQMKLCNRIGEALEAMSKEAPTPQDALERVPMKGALLLAGTEFAKLVAMTKSEGIGWTHLVGRDVERLIGALEAAPEVEVEEKDVTPIDRKKKRRS